ncbi:putative endopeptidase Clp [Helianthus annuus]|uniref:ATP-dependent Clp protease proteolytic subunit n=1 Tax=Helianthus annuus TaxID=4232 RepID=A0A9K3ISV4_HELAN|nr:putative endopeptidase Clp [Helianthus annuus]KAJ0560486.1 putative endopeptidase Clp [Helianthus annuus]KAJ0566842.1 putative endopeptidase Clp [Helianthus annuus]KAJ0573515.1 putative endopeptidase Clp [Helianthus annuus]KAJ0911832.1 putative endopeptidase Clp [Helianthus annuus]
MRRKEDKKERKTNSYLVYLVKNQRKSYYYKLEGTCYEKKKKYWNLHIDSFFFFEPYASKGACTVPKGYNLTLINRLYREILLFLGQEVDSEIPNQLIGLMIYLSIEDDAQDLYLFINSPGGWVIPVVALYDTMQFVQPDVHTICMGSAASTGSFILVGGEITKHLAFPHAWHQ